MQAKRIVRALQRTLWSGPAGLETPRQPASHVPGHLHTLLGWRLTGLGLNPKDIERHDPHMLLELRSSCALCADKRRCLEDMMDFRHPPGWEDYCPNAAAIRALLATPGAAKAGITSVGDCCQSR
jgi:hypothetical protein